MVQAYNFLAAWQLFPEKGAYELGERPKSGIYKIESLEGKKELVIHHHWVTLENQALASQYNVAADRDLHPFEQHELADQVQVNFPYSASVAGAVIKANEEGMIRHKALTAMEEQTNMQLQQIRKQIELLALQAQEIQKRKELSLMIYSAKLSFKPNIGQVYFLYEKHDGSHTLSLVSPKEWGAGAPFKKFVAGVKLLADHTWMEL